MINAGRVAIVVFAAILVGLYTCASAFDVDRTGFPGTVLYSAAFDWAFLVFPVLAIALANRWWALLVAFVPFATLFYLHTATDYVYPYHEDPYPAITAMVTVALLSIYSLGFLLRVAFDQVIAARLLPRLRNKLD